MTIFGQQDMFSPDVIFYEQVGYGKYQKCAYPLQISSVIENENGSSRLRLKGGESIDVQLPFDELMKRIHAVNMWHPTLDLLDCTGDKAALVVKEALLSEAFARAVSGQRIEGQSFLITAYVADDAEDLLDNSGTYKFEFKSAETEFFRISEESKDITYVSTWNTGFYIRLPHAVLEQFYTHAHREEATKLDLCELTDPAGVIQQNPALIKQLPKLYTSIVKPKG